MASQLQAQSGKTATDQQICLAVVKVVHGKVGGQGEESCLLSSSPPPPPRHTTESPTLDLKAVLPVRFVLIVFSIWVVAEPDFASRSSLMRIYSGMEHHFLFSFLDQCIGVYGCTYAMFSCGDQWMTSGVHPHLPPCLRQVLFVVYCCMHQASWPVSSLPCLPPHCRSAGITGANSLTQLLQGL